MNTAVTAFYYFTISLLISVLFVVDCAGHYLVYYVAARSSWLSPFSERGNLILLFTLGWSLALFGLLIDQDLLQRLSALLSVLIMHMKQVLFNKTSWLVVVSAALFVFFGRHMYSNDTVASLLAAAGRQLWGIAVGMFPVFIALATAFVFYQVFSFVGRLLQSQAVTVETAYREWSAGSAILMSLVVILAIGSLRIKLGSGDYQGIWRGMVKDYAVYSLIIVFFVNGLARWANCADAFPAKTRWAFFGVAVVVSILCALGALILDHLFVFALERGTVAKHLHEWQRDRIIDFIHMRDYGVLVPMCVIQLLYVFYKLIGLAKAVPQ